MKKEPSPGRRCYARMSGAMWCLLVLFFISTATQQSTARIPSVNIQLGMSGYNPLMADVMDQPDQGRKWCIFQAQERDSIYNEKQGGVLNSFVEEVPPTKCAPSFNEAVIRSFEQYKCFSAGMISFATEGDAITTYGATQFNFRDKAGHGNLNNPNSNLVRHFFNQSHGELRLIKASCITHTVGILPFHEPVFTPAFLSALHLLNEAAKDTKSENKGDVFTQFVETYGTHFASTTQFGYQAYFGKFFRTQAKNVTEEAARNRCMMESASETLAAAARRECKTTAQCSSPFLVDECGDEEVSAMVTGSVTALGGGDLTAHESPRPVAHILKKITALFKQSWFSSRTRKLETSQVPLNATALTAYFDEFLPENSMDVIDKAKTPATSLCSWRSSVTPNMAVRLAGLPERKAGTMSSPTTPSSTSPAAMTPPTTTPATTTPSSTTPAETTPPTTAPSSTTPAATTPPTTTPATIPATGGIIIVGGRKAGGTPSTLGSVALFTAAPPLFPVPVYGNTLSRVGSKIYSCGGRAGNEIKCWHIAPGIQDTWQSFDIPWELVWHSAVVVQEEIWLFQDSKMHILKTSNPAASNTRTINLGFSFGEDICAASHGSQTFVIGVGGGRDEVHVNKDCNDPGQWELHSRLQQGRYWFCCIAHGTKIIVTGGRAAGTFARLSSAEAISVLDGTVRTISPLGGVRAAHQMAIIHGRPAVLGGYNGTAMATIEAYDEHKNVWETLADSLNEPRSWFGLTQYSL